MTLSLSDKDFALVEYLASAKDTGKSAVLSEALSLLQWYEKERAEGARILIERPGGQLRELLKF